MIDLTVIIPAYGAPRVVRPLLAGLAAQASALGERLRVVVSDDGSPSPLAPALLGTAPDSLLLEVVRSNENGGPGAARNRALAIVDTGWVACLDADEVPGDAWLERVAQTVVRQDAPDAVEGRVQGSSERATPFNHAGEFAETASAPMGLGGNNLFRTSVLRAVGGFDERYYDRGRRLHFREDTDLYFRLLDHGARVEHDQSLVVYHPPLPRSFLTPVREARRYYFDPLLAREHPARFRSLVTSRRAGPVPLRAARHEAAMALGAGLATWIGGVVSRRARVTWTGAILTVAAWAVNVLAVTWRRRVLPKDVPAVAAVALLAPLEYLRSYWRGVLAHRHRPRLWG